MASYFTIADLLAIWQSSVDSLYAQPFLDAGDGGGLEAYDQAFAQYERVSQAIERTMQSLYILPSSSQTNEPASGDVQATVSLTLSRTTYFHVPIVFTAAMVAVEESATDHGVDAGIAVLTGRRYYLTTSLVFEPGSVGPYSANAVAEAPGYSYNNPEPGSITAFYQPGAGQHNNRATIISSNVTDHLYAMNEYATFVAASVGQYVILSSPVNDGKVRRIVDYAPPGTTPIVHGGKIGLAQDVWMQVAAGAAYVVGERVTDVSFGATGVVLHYNASTHRCLVQRVGGFFVLGGMLTGETSGAANAIASIDMDGMQWALYLGAVGLTWTAGETVTEAVTGATGTFRYNESLWAVVSPISGTFAGTHPITGASSGVVMTPTQVGVEPSLVDEAGTAGWRILRWSDDLGFGATNALSPTGGRIGMLDELGRERNLPRGNGEDDVRYRRRVAQLPDTVSPNAIRRACARFFTPHGWACDFREVGTLDFPGMFYDVPASDAPTYGYAYDMDFTARPADRFRVWTDYPEFRAFFLIGVPRTGVGEFGFGYDLHPLGFYDIGPLADYYDGAPVGEGLLNASLWNDIVEKKAGGVGFDFYAK